MKLFSSSSSGVRSFPALARPAAGGVAKKQHRRQEQPTKRKKDPEQVRELEGMYSVRWSARTLNAERLKRKNPGWTETPERDLFGAGNSNKKKRRTKEEHMRAWGQLSGESDSDDELDRGLHRVLQDPMLGHGTGAWSLAFAVEFTALRLRDGGVPRHMVAAKLMRKVAPFLAREEIGKTSASSVPIDSGLHAFIRKTLDAAVPPGCPKTAGGDAAVADVLRAAGFRYLRDRVFCPDRVAVERDLANRIKAGIDRTLAGARGSEDEEEEEDSDDGDGDGDDGDDDGDDGDADGENDGEGATTTTATTTTTTTATTTTAATGTATEDGGLSRAQARALRIMTRAAYARGVAVLAGAAGSGKTRVTGDFVHEVRSGEMGERMTTTVCAVTHKALSMSRDSLLGRFEELKAHVESGTLHFRTIASLLFAKAGGGDLARQSKVLVVEEASMVGAADMAALLDAFEGRAVLLVGDYAQLPSIAWGEAFYGAVRIARRWRGGRGLAELTAVRRSGGGVLRLASAVRDVIDAEGDEERRGRMPAVALALAGGDGVVVAGAETQGGEGSSISTRIARLYMEALRRQAAARGCKLGEAQMHVQVLCPNRDGTNPARPNIDDLNAAVRLELATEGVIAGPDVEAALKKADVGDRRAALRRLPPQLGEKVVVADRTDADCALNRNDFGVVFGVDRKKQRYEVEGKAHSATLPASALRPGHAETCHSYQGDEMQEVILAANECSFPCDGRLLYSGLTRAKATLLLPDATVFIALERYCRALWRPSLML